MGIQVRLLRLVVVVLVLRLPGVRAQVQMHESRCVLAASASSGHNPSSTGAAASIMARIRGTGLLVDCRSFGFKVWTRCEGAMLQLPPQKRQAVRGSLLRTHL